MSRSKELRAALDASWLLFTKGGFAVLPPMATLMVALILRAVGHKWMNWAMIGMSLLVIYTLIVFISLIPFWMTLMSYALPKRTTPS